MIPSRRAFLSLWPAAVGLAAEKPVLLPSEAVRYPDPATENTVYRLTNPTHTSLLPGYEGRCVSRHGNFLLYASDRSAEFQAYRMDVKSGQSRQLTGAANLEPASLTLLPDEKSCCFVADGWFTVLNLSTYRERQAYRIGDGFVFSTGLSVSADGQYAAFVESKQGEHFRLRLLHVPGGSAVTVAESASEIADPCIRPRRAGILYRMAGRELHVVSFDGGQKQRLRTAPGGIGPAVWNQDGRAVSYLSFPEDRKQLNSLREYAPDSNEDRLIATTSQYVHFGSNADASVFVGASGSKASPYLLLLVRAVRRELTLCEHKAQDARQVAPIFSPNSQRVFFQTDRHGKMAIYSMAVDRLVEQTE